jgi:hypothetical protein
MIRSILLPGRAATPGVYISRRHARELQQNQLHTNIIFFSFESILDYISYFVAISFYEITSITIIHD